MVLLPRGNRRCCIHTHTHTHTHRWSKELDLVVREAKGAELRLEVPDHQAPVLRARDELLHVRIERHAVDCILVPAEGPLERRVLSAHPVAFSWREFWDSYCPLSIVEIYVSATGNCAVFTCRVAKKRVLQM